MWGGGLFRGMGLQKKKAAEYAQICGIKPNMSEISFDEMWAEWEKKQLGWKVLIL